MSGHRADKVGIVIDMGGTMIKIGIVREGILLSNTSLIAGNHSSLKERLNEIGDVVDELLSGKAYQPIGVGIAFPGIVNSSSGKILSRYVKYPDAQEINLPEWAMNRWSLPLVIENDARAALVGEWKYGAGKGNDNLVLVTLGTGFGSAVMIDGKLLRGKNHLAGNLGGHMTINLSGRQCNCGNIGCLETECSSWAIGNYVRNLSGYEKNQFKDQEISFKNIFKASAEGNEFMSNVVEHCLKAWSLGIISLIHAYDPDLVIIGGGVMKSEAMILPYVKKMVAQHSWVKEETLLIHTACEIEFAGLLGMYHLLEQKNNQV